jgi:hypothetical protein
MVAEATRASNPAKIWQAQSELARSPRWAAGTGAVRRLPDTDVIETMDRREIGETETTGNDRNRTRNWTAARGNHDGLRIGVVMRDIKATEEAVDMKVGMIEEKTDINLRK